MQKGFVIGDRGLGASGDTHPGWMAAHAEVGAYLVVGASAAGQIHLEHGKPRDDAFVIRSLGPWLAVGVSDGVGSRPLSRYGASYACESLTALLLRPFGGSLQTTRTSEGAGQQDSKDKFLAPPPTIEEVDFTPTVVRPVRSDSVLKKASEGLRKVIWELVPKKGQTDAMAHTSGASSRNTIYQAASSGWWLTSLYTEPSFDEKPPLAQSTTNATDSDAEGMNGVTLPKGTQDFGDMPNLVATMERAFEKSHLGLQKHAQSLGVELADLSCTALALLLNLETGHGVVGQIGDGALLGLRAHGEVQEMVNAPDTGDPQATYTLNRRNFKDYLAVQVIQPLPVNPFVAYYVMTDGLSGDLLYSPDTEALLEWARLVDLNLRISPSLAQAAAGMLNWLATFQVKGSWDDRTLVVVTRKERNNGERQVATGEPQSAQPTDT